MLMSDDIRLMNITVLLISIFSSLFIFPLFALQLFMF